LWLIALVIFSAIIWKAVPVRIRVAEFETFLEDQALYAARSSGEAIEKRVLARAVEMRIPLDKENISVRKSPKHVRITCEYTIPLEFPGYTYHWHFEHIIDRQIFII
jgi:hypothetical protein